MSLDQSQQSEGELRLKVRFDANSLRLEHTLIGVTVHLGDCFTAGRPGAPALPVRMARIALPRGTRATGLVVETRETARLADAPVPLAPLQPPRPAATQLFAYCRPDEGREKGWRRDGMSGDDRPPGLEPFPVPPYVAPDPELYAAAAAEPAARLLRTDEDGPTPVATIALRPVRITDEGHLEFSAELDLAIGLDTGGETAEESPTVVSRAQAMRDVALSRCNVINPDDVYDYSDRFPIGLLSAADYLIVTDNNLWDAWTQTPLREAGGDVVASFERLAQWKRQRGLRVSVVTITDIVGGRWGDFRSGSRDLPETIRNFLKMAYRQWGVAWVLIGGDTEIVPIRYAAGGREGEIARQAVDPPPDNASTWAGDHLRLKAVKLGLLWYPSPLNLLVRVDDGRLIPYDVAGTSDSVTPGWFFTTSATYATRSPIPTVFVRVNGPASLIDADVQFLYLWNVIPTDLYYSSLVGPHYDQPGKHDWDLVDNGVHGQTASGNELDGINYMPTVSLGRAPVNNAAQADTFVDKVIAYERFEQPDGTPLQADWPGRAVLVADNWNWGGRLGIGGSAANPPGPGRFHHAPGTNHSVIHLSELFGWHWSLLAMVAPDDLRLLPYRTDAEAVGRGWYFARSATDLSPNNLPVPVGGVVLDLVQPSHWLAVFGAAEELTPLLYFLNDIGVDESLLDQEELRAQLQAQMNIHAPRRLYEDLFDMTADQLAAGPVEPLTRAGLRAALNAGPHIVSLSGHGSSDGCCKLDRNMAGSLANGGHTFIAYADSCLTNQIDGSAMGEALLNNPNGGAVAYVGSTRFSWISLGDDFQRLFFSHWAALGGEARLGLLADTRAALFDVSWPDSHWTVLSLNLLGCPEMPLWSQRSLILREPEIQIHRDRILLRIDPGPPDPPFRVDPPYRAEWDVTRVHVRQGDHEYMLAVRGGSIDAPLTGFRSGPATVTIARAGHRPIVREVAITPRFSGWAVAGVALVVLLVVLLIVWRG